MIAPISLHTSGAMSLGGEIFSITFLMLRVAAAAAVAPAPAAALRGSLLGGVIHCIMLPCGRGRACPFAVVHTPSLR